MTHKEKQQKFADWCDSLPVKIWPIARNLIITHCAITPDVLSNWKTGRTEIPNSMIPIIEKIASKNIFDETSSVNKE